ncbi:MAG: OadG family transporter subunit [Anaerolineales bacterium]
MTEALATALQITLIGMSVVMGVIVLLWLLMALLVRLAADRPAPAAEPPEGAALRQRAAAAAVAVVLAGQTEAGAPGPWVPPTAAVSPWQAALRANQLKQRGRWR